MKKTTWLIALPLGLVGLAVWGGWQIVNERDHESAYGLLEEARALIEESPDEAVLAQRMLDRGLAFDPPPALTEALLTERAELRSKSGSKALALADWRQILAMHPDDEGIRLKIAGLESNLGNREEALRIYRTLLAEKESNGWVRAYVALENERTARELEDATLASLAERVSPDELAWLQSIFSRVVRLPIKDPIRQGLISKLQGRLNDEALQVLEPAIEELTSQLEGVREDDTMSLRTSVNRNNLASFIDLYFSSERYEETVDFGLAALPFEASLSHPLTIQDLALALSSLGRPKAAAEIVNRAVQDDPTWHVDFLNGWCSILYQAENWPNLENAATQLMRSPEAVTHNPHGKSDGAFYFGIAAFKQGRNSAAIGALKQFIAARTEGPVPDALGEAWATIAEAQTLLEDRSAAASAWRSCTEAAPNYSAKAWLEKAKSDARNPQGGLGESRAYAHAIVLEPDKTATLLPAFIAAGKRMLVQRGIDLNALANQLETEGRWYPSGTPSTYLLYALAQRQLESREPVGASLIFKRILRGLPGFVPALDGLAVTQLVLKDPLGQAETMLERLALSGPDPVVLAGLKDVSGKLDGQELPPELLRRWMQLDPGFVGAIEFSRALRAAGRPQEALATLAGVPRNLFNDRDRVLFAEILAGLGDDKRVLTATESVSPKGPYALRAALLRTQAAVGLADFDQLSASIERLEQLAPLVEDGSPEAELVESTFSRLLSARLGPAVLRFSRVFATSSGARDGRRMNQAALAETLFGEPDAARVWVDAADALSQDGSSIVGRLILAEAQDDVDLERSTMRDLRAESPAWLTDLDWALMSALEGRSGEARAALDELIDMTPGDSRPWLGRAALDATSPLGALPDYQRAGSLLGPAAVKPLERIATLGPQAGRRLLTILLALHAPVWDAWALDRIHGPIQQNLLGPFAIQLEARAQLANDQLKEAQVSLTDGASRWKAFLPFWDLNEDLALAKYGRPDHPAVVALRRKRREVGAPPRGATPTTQAELSLDASFEAAAAGDQNNALVQAKLACKSAPTAAAPRLNLARVAEKLEPKTSRKAYLDYLLDPDWTLEMPEVHELMAELLNLSLALELDQLEALHARYPDAPEPVLELAKRDAKTDSIETAFERLRAFAKDQPALESLGLGLSRPWFDFMLQYAPSEALDFATDQLDRDPRWLEPWTQQAQALEKLGELDSALALWRTLAEMSPSPQVALGHASIVASLGGEHREVLDALRIARQGSEAGANAGRIDFINARSLANIGTDYLGQAIDQLDALLKRDSTPGVTRDEIQRRLGITLLHRAAPGDGPRASAMLLAASKDEADPMTRDLLISLSNLGRNLDKELQNRAAESEAESATE